MNRIFGAVMIATACLGFTAAAFADTSTTAQVTAPQQSQVVQLQNQVSMLATEVTALQGQNDTPSPSENVINNLATGG